MIIKKAQIKNRLFLSSEYSEREGNVKRNLKEDSDAPIHEDLRNAFMKLVPHLILICQQLPKESVKHIIENEDYTYDHSDEFKDEIFKMYFVDGFVKKTSKDGDGLTGGVILSGRRMLSSGKSLELNPPMIKYDASKDEAYEYLEELQEAVAELEHEVYAYVKEGKQASSTQTSLFEEEEFDPNSDEVDESFIEEDEAA